MQAQKEAAGIQAKQDAKDKRRQEAEKLLAYTNKMRAKNDEKIQRTVIAKFKLKKMLESKTRREAETAQREENVRKTGEEEAARAAKRAITEEKHKKAQEAWAKKDARRHAPHPPDHSPAQRVGTKHPRPNPGTRCCFCAGKKSRTMRKKRRNNGSLMPAKRRKVMRNEG